MKRIYVAFDSDWREPPGRVVQTFSTRKEAEDFCYEEKFGHGYSVVEVPIPNDFKLGDDNA